MPEEGYFSELFNDIELFVSTILTNLFKPYFYQNCIANASSIDGGGWAHFIFNIHSAAYCDVFLAGIISQKE